MSVAVGLVAPQQAEPSMVLGNLRANITFSNGNTTFTPLSSASVTESDRIFEMMGVTVIPASVGTTHSFTWSGSGPTTDLMDEPIMNAWAVSSAHFDLTKLIFSMLPTTDVPGLIITGKGTVSGFVGGNPVSFPAEIDYEARFPGEPIEHGFTFSEIDLLMYSTFAVQSGESARQRVSDEPGSGVGLLAATPGMKNSLVEPSAFALKASALCYPRVCLSVAILPTSDVSAQAFHSN